VFVARALPGPAVEKLSQVAEVRVWPEPLPPPPGVLRAEAARSEGIITLLTDTVDRALLEAAPSLRAVSNLAVGFDNVDVAACTARRIPVGNTPGVLTETTADFAFALLLGAARRLVEGDAYVRAGRWQTWEPGLLLGRDVFGATLGIVGFGGIGQAVARRAKGFGMRILVSSRTPCAAKAAELGAEEVPLERLLEESDFVSLHVPLSEATRHLIEARALGRMKPTAILINTARGPVVDPAALNEALRAGTLRAAALDVTEPEPIPLDHPLLGAPNLLIAPHIGSASEATRSRMAQMAVDNLLAALEGRRPPNCVNPEVFER
jgi:glyoxylate reductase